jgi:hypothetical protein
MEQIQVVTGVILSITACVTGIYYLGVYLGKW